MPPGPRSPDRRATRQPHRGARRDGRAAARRPSALTGAWRDLIDFGALLLLVTACALGGGSSFVDVPSLLYVRPLAVICLLVFLLSPAPADWRVARVPLLFLSALAVLMLVQLVPLPPGVWTALPGRAPYTGIAPLMGIAQPWRPISLTPDLTANALAALIVPAAMLVGFAKLRDDQRRATIVVLIVLCFLSAVFGLAQFAGGKDSPLYLYQRTYEGFPVGFLSNRNHQAALLSLLFPALRVWTLSPATSRAWARNRQWLALGMAVFAVPIVLATGSRAGIGLMILGIVAALLLFPAPPAPRDERGTAWWRRATRLALPIAAGGLILATWLLGRAASIERFLSLSSGSDLRFQLAPVVVRIARENLPLGTGFGSFDPVFRQYEPDSALISTYFNHAHNELLELAIMAGIPGLALLVAFLLWWGARFVAAMRADATGDRDTAAAARIVRLGGCAVAFLLLAALVDYPLRPPLMSAVFALACAWVAAPLHGRGADRGGIVTDDASG